MTFDEWAKEYPAKRALSLPPKDSWAYDHPLPSYQEAEKIKDFIEMTDEHGGMIVVEWEGQFYVVYDGSYFHGFADYNELMS